MSTKKIAHFESTLKKLFLILCYDDLSSSTVLNKIRVVLNDHLPVVGISLSTLFNGYLYNVSSSDEMDDILFPDQSKKIDDDIFKAIHDKSMRSETSSINLSCEDFILKSLVKDTKCEGFNAVYVPLGAFSGVPGRSQFIIYLSNDTVPLEDAVVCCEYFRPALVFLASLLFRFENRHFEDGKLTPSSSVTEDGNGEHQENEWETLAEVNKEHIRRVLTHTRGKVAGKTGAAERLGLKPSTLWAKIRKYDIEISHIKNEST